MALYPAGFADFPTSLFRLEQSRNVTLRGLTSYDMLSTLSASSGWGEGIPCLEPDKWVSVFEVPPGLMQNVTTQLLDRPVLYRRT